MKRETRSVAFACALGACIGTLLALDIAARFQYGSYFWGIGALFGGMVAYIAVDFRHFCAGVAHSYQRTIAWRPNRLYWRAWLASYVQMWSFMATTLMLMGLMVIGACYFQLDPTMKPMTFSQVMSMVYYLLVYWWPGFSLTLGLFMSFAPVGRDNYIKTDAEYEEKLHRVLDEKYKEAFHMSPLGVVYWSVRGIVWVLKNSPRLIAEAARFIAAIAILLAQFVAGVFVYVHSSRRTLCFVDATLGAAIGYIFGSAIIGAVAGVVLGVINYELISVRLLKLTPQTSN